jgi:hypothetical protein
MALLTNLLSTEYMIGDLVTKNGFCDSKEYTMIG